MDTLPSYWRRAGFSVSETAELIDVSADTLRTWLARNVSPEFQGKKTGGRLWLSGLEAFYFLLVRDFTAFGTPVRTAMLTAAEYARAAADSPPNGLVTVRFTDGVSTFDRTGDPDFSTTSTLVVPMGRLARDLIERAAATHAVAAH